MTDKKIISLEELGQITARLKKQGKTIAHCHGCFDLMHPGHIKHFEAAKELADVLVVTLTPDRFVNKGP
ncbi:MAG TPA: adenylyltransferase/cytidyltransferase family protein, partial [Bacteroidia bacterium]